MFVVFLKPILESLKIYKGPSHKNGNLSRDLKKQSIYETRQNFLKDLSV